LDIILSPGFHLTGISHRLTPRFDASVSRRGVTQPSKAGIGSRRNANHRLARSAMILDIIHDSFTHAVDRTRRSGADSSSCHRSDEENRMHWKKRHKQIQYLRAKHRNDRSSSENFSGRIIHEFSFCLRSH
jgi:hypothetical protein